MQTVQIVSVPAGTTAHLFPARIAQGFSGPHARPEAHHAPQWLKDFGVCFANNTSAGWEAARKLKNCFQAQPDITTAAVLALFQQLATTIHEREEEQKVQRRRQIAHLLLDHPELFQQTAFGRQEAVGFAACIMEEDTTWSMLERAYVRAEMMVDCWIAQL